MTHRFHVSRLAEIAVAAPVEPVSFPTRAEVAVVRRRMREILAGHGGCRDSEPSPKPHRRARTR